VKPVSLEATLGVLFSLGAGERAKLTAEDRSKAADFFGFGELEAKAAGYLQRLEVLEKELAELRGTYHAFRKEIAIERALAAGSTRSIALSGRRALTRIRPAARARSSRPSGRHTVRAKAAWHHLRIGGSLSSSASARKNTQDTPLRSGNKLGGLS
jgi:hypothetical protein